MQESPLHDLSGGESVLSDAGIPSRDRQIVDNISFPVYSGIRTESYRIVTISSYPWFIQMHKTLATVRFHFYPFSV